MGKINKIRIGGIAYDISDLATQEALENEIERAEGIEEELKNEDLKIKAIAELCKVEVDKIKTEQNNLSNKVDTKQNVLVSGNNIKTVNGLSLVGSGNIDLATLSGSSSADAAPIASTLNFTTTEDSVILEGNTLGGESIEVEIPAATTDSAGVMSAEDKRDLDNALKAITEDVSVVEEQIDITDNSGKLIIRITPDGVFEENTRMTQLYGVITTKSYCKADGTITTSSTVSYTEYNVEKINNVIVKTVIRPSNSLPLYVGFKNGVKVKHYTPPTTGPSVLPISELVDCSDIDTIKVNWIVSSGAQAYIPQDSTLNEVNESINDSVGLFIGDSLMQGVGALIGYDAVSYVGKYLGIKTLNAGIGGTTMRKNGRDANLYEIVESYKNKDFSKPISYINSSLSGDFKDEVLSRYEVVSNTPIDIISFIFINYGANDWKATGTVLDNDENKEDVTTVLGSLRYAVRTFIELNPYIQILVSTPGYRTAEEDTPEVNGISMGAFCDAIEKACGELHIPCWNQYRHNGVNRYNADLYLSDGTHRTAYGYAALGKQYANFISNNFAKIEI